MDCSSFAPLLPGAAWAGALHLFVKTAPIDVAWAAWAVFAAVCSGAAGLLGTAATWALALLTSVLAVVVGILTSNATQIILSVALIVGWQILYPSKFLLAALARVPYCNGVAFDFAPADSETAKKHRKYVALTLDDGPCPYNSEPVLDLLSQHNARATFFIIGAHVEQCDVRGAGDGHAELGKATLRRMVAEGHELGNHTWHDRPSHKLTPAQLSQELSDVHQLITSARQIALAAEAAGNESDDDLSVAPSMANTNTNSLSYGGGGGTGAGSSIGYSSGRRFRWFRPGCGWFTPEMVEAAQKLGYRTVLGSVWPWDTHSSYPLLNALYIISKVYCGAVIVLHDRRRHLLPTLQYVLPWLAWWGYEVVTLGEAATRSIGGSGQELTSDVLEALNADASLLAGGGGATSTVDSVAINPDKLKLSASYVAQMAKERERAAIIAAAEEAERQRIKAEKRAAADRRAGIDRRLVDMSAAEKRMIERREREKKEAEKRRIRRKAEEIRAKERYDEYVRQKAEDEIRRREEERVAAIKAKEAEERRKVAEEEHKRRTESQRAAAAEMVARMKAEQEAAEAAAASGEITAASTVGGSTAGSTFGDSVSGDKKKKSKLAFLKKLGGKLGSKKHKGDKQAEGGEPDEADTATDAAPIAAGVFGVAAATAAAGAVAAGAAAGAGCGTSGGAAYSSFCEPHTTYAWYGVCEATPEREASLAQIDAALAAQSAAISEAMQQAAAAEQPPPAEITAGDDDDDDDADAAAAAYRPAAAIPSASAAAAALASLEASLPAPAVGDFARGPTGKILLGFDAQPLLMAQNPDGQAVVLNSQGEALTGPGNEQLVLLLGAHGTPLVDPHGRPVFMAIDQGSGRLLGVHPDGSIIMVPSSEQAAALAAATAAAAAAGSDSAAATAASAGDGSAGGSGSEAAGSIKEPDSYAPSLARSSIRSSQSAAAAAAGVAAAGAADTPLAGSASPALGDFVLPPAASAGPALAGAAVDEPAGRPGLVPATLLLGPQGKPLLGLDNRPLIVAVDEDGVPLALSSEGHVLLGLDDRPLQLAFASDGSLVALDSQCRPLSGPDGKPRVVALDRDGRPMLDEGGRPVLLALGPNGLPLPDSASPSARVSWAGSASGARLSHSGTQGTLAGGAGTGLEVMVCSGEDAVGVVDAADYGEFSAAAVGVGAMSAAAGAGLGAGCYLAATHSGGISGTAAYGAGSAVVEEGSEQAQQQHMLLLPSCLPAEEEEAGEAAAPSAAAEDDEFTREAQWELQQYQRYQQQQQQQHVAAYQLHHSHQQHDADDEPACDEQQQEQQLQPAGGEEGGVMLQRREAQADESVAAAFGREDDDVVCRRDQAGPGAAAAAALESGSSGKTSSVAELLQMVEVTATSGSR